MTRYIHLWLFLSKMAFHNATSSYVTMLFFVFGKLLRFVLLLGFLLLLQVRTTAIGEYTQWEVVLFFTTFNFIDTASQLFFREVYRFKPHITSGTFDLFLLRPISPLFQSLLSGLDLLDVPLLIISLGGILFAALMIGDITWASSLFFFLLLCNGMLISAAFHIFILCMGILSSTVDQLLWVYRDVTIIGRVPVNIYQEPVRSIMTFVIPVGIMVTFPAQAMLGLLHPVLIVIAFLISGSLFTASILLWRYALRQYASASS